MFSSRIGLIKLTQTEERMRIGIFMINFDVLYFVVVHWLFGVDGVVLQPAQKNSVSQPDCESLCAKQSTN